MEHHYHLHTDGDVLFRSPKPDQQKLKPNFCTMWKRWEEDDSIIITSRIIFCVMMSWQIFDIYLENMLRMCLVQAFAGTQNVSNMQKDEAWKVNVRLQGCDMQNGYLCGSMEALNVPAAETPVFFCKSCPTDWKDGDHLLHMWSVSNFGISCLMFSCVADGRFATLSAICFNLEVVFDMLVYVV